MTFNNLVCQDVLKNKIDIFNSQDPYLYLLYQYYSEYKNSAKNAKNKCYRCGGRGHLARECEDKCPKCLLSHKNKPCIADLINVTKNVLDIKNRYNEVLRIYRKKKTFKIDSQNALAVLEEMIKEEKLVNKRYIEKINSDNNKLEMSNRKKVKSNIEDLILADVERWEYNKMIKEIGKKAKEMQEDIKRKIILEYNKMEKEKISQIRNVLSKKYEIMDRYKRWMEKLQDKDAKQGMYKMMKLELAKLRTEDKVKIQEIKQVQKLGVQKIAEVTKGKKILISVQPNKLADLMNELSIKKKDLVRYYHGLQYYNELLKENDKDLELFDTFMMKQKLFKTLDQKKRYILEQLNKYKMLKEKCNKEIQIIDYKINNF